MAKLKFLFLMGNDLKKIQSFYNDGLGIATGGDPEQGWLDVDLGIHMIYFKSDFDIAQIKEWAWQPGYKGGSGNLTSWSIELEMDSFKKALLGLKKTGAPLLNEKPEWRRDSYWGLTVKDPMGNTIEVYTTPKTQPEETEWL